MAKLAATLAVALALAGTTAADGHGVKQVTPESLQPQLSQLSTNPLDFPAVVGRSITHTEVFQLTVRSASAAGTQQRVEGPPRELARHDTKPVVSRRRVSTGEMVRRSQRPDSCKSTAGISTGRVKPRALNPASLPHAHPSTTSIELEQLRATNSAWPGLTLLPGSPRHPSSTDGEAELRAQRPLHIDRTLAAFENQGRGWGLLEQSAALHSSKRARQSGGSKDGEQDALISRFRAHTLAKKSTSTDSEAKQLNTRSKKQPENWGINWGSAHQLETAGSTKPSTSASTSATPPKQLSGAALEQYRKPASLKVQTGVASALERAAQIDAARRQQLLRTVQNTRSRHEGSGSGNSQVKKAHSQPKARGLESRSTDPEREAAQLSPRAAPLANRFSSRVLAHQGNSIKVASLETARHLEPQGMGMKKLVVTGQTDPARLVKSKHSMYSDIHEGSPWLQSDESIGHADNDHRLGARSIAKSEAARLNRRAPPSTFWWWKAFRQSKGITSGLEAARQHEPVSLKKLVDTHLAGASMPAHSRMNMDEASPRWNREVKISGLGAARLHEPSLHKDAANGWTHPARLTQPKDAKIDMTEASPSWHPERGLNQPGRDHGIGARSLRNDDATRLDRRAPPPATRILRPLREALHVRLKSLAAARKGEPDLPKIDQVKGWTVSERLAQYRQHQAYAEQREAYNQKHGHPETHEPLHLSQSEVGHRHGARSLPDDNAKHLNRRAAPPESTTYAGTSQFETRDVRGNRQAPSSQSEWHENDHSYHPFPYHQPDHEGPNGAADKALQHTWTNQPKLHPLKPSVYSLPGVSEHPAVPPQVRKHWEGSQPAHSPIAQQQKTYEGGTRVAGSQNRLPPIARPPQKTPNEVMKDMLQTYRTASVGKDREDKGRLRPEPTPQEAYGQKLGEKPTTGTRNTRRPIAAPETATQDMLFSYKAALGGSAREVLNEKKGLRQEPTPREAYGQKPGHQSNNGGTHKVAQPWKALAGHGIRARSITNDDTPLLKARGLLHPFPSSVYHLPRMSTTAAPTPPGVVRQHWSQYDYIPAEFPYEHDGQDRKYQAIRKARIYPNPPLPTVYAGPQAANFVPAGVKKHWEDATSSRSSVGQQRQTPAAISQKSSSDTDRMKKAMETGRDYHPQVGILGKPPPQTHQPQQVHQPQQPHQAVQIHQPMQEFHIPHLPAMPPPYVPAMNPFSQVAWVYNPRISPPTGVAPPPLWQQAQHAQAQAAHAQAQGTRRVGGSRREPYHFTAEELAQRQRRMTWTLERRRKLLGEDGTTNVASTSTEAETGTRHPEAQHAQLAQSAVTGPAERVDDTHVITVSTMRPDARATEQKVWKPKETQTDPSTEGSQSSTPAIQEQIAHAQEHLGRKTLAQRQIELSARFRKNMEEGRLYARMLNDRQGRRMARLLSRDQPSRDFSPSFVNGVPYQSDHKKLRVRSAPPPRDFQTFAFPQASPSSPAVSPEASYLAPHVVIANSRHDKLMRTIEQAREAKAARERSMSLQSPAHGQYHGQYIGQVHGPNLGQNLGQIHGQNLGQAHAQTHGTVPQAGANGLANQLERTHLHKRSPAPPSTEYQHNRSPSFDAWFRATPQPSAPPQPTQHWQIVQYTPQSPQQTTHHVITQAVENHRQRQQAENLGSILSGMKLQDAHGHDARSKTHIQKRALHVPRSSSASSILQERDLKIARRQLALGPAHEAEARASVSAADVDDLAGGLQRLHLEPSSPHEPQVLSPMKQSRLDELKAFHRSYYGQPVLPGRAVNFNGPLRGLARGGWANVRHRLAVPLSLSRLPQDRPSHVSPPETAVKPISVSTHLVDSRL